MPDRIDLVIDLVREVSGKVDLLDDRLRIHRSVDHMQLEHRLTCVEKDVQLKTKLGAAAAGGLPALGALVYFLLNTIL